MIDSFILIFNFVIDYIIDINVLIVNFDDGCLLMIPIFNVLFTCTFSITADICI